jgi:sulfur transfer complex TusBCD TusB component (DsrH family)
MLHIVTKFSLIERCLRYAAPQDEIVFLQNEEVYLTVGRTSTLNLINYDKFVELAVKHHKTLTWH